ncbi:conserved hypothetical protein [Beutenbergia cavernae DSM 12333]|uniref:Uridine kinase n=1 Tax=Beutenbergia cavernae (strain ATCC BAA-8 / DSM 12333 / CCUG 43141 / JCM 11478 / NBRC 16432 / NCIMB 13614 / HKI 0122) TaxID=471853 RepID=C5BW14_BEUC1|nr:uridine kinase [Beutenbergia cavernae]ACQ80615.1 conserved hypothetical protein [Beutenbergia cavernae DSM 12333]
MSVEADVLDDLVRAALSRPALLGPPGGDVEPVRLVCVDGLAGAGKTTLAAQLGAALAAQVVHMDDLYPGWGGLLEAPALLATWVLDPMAAGRAGRYRRFDWAAGAYAEWHDVPRRPALVVEGCGAAPRAVDGVASLVIWVEADDELRLARGLERDGTDAEEHWRAWMRDERRLAEREGTGERADVVLDAWGGVVRP